MKGKANRKHGKNSSLGFIEDVHHQFWTSVITNCTPFYSCNTGVKQMLYFKNEHMLICIERS